MCAEEKVVKFTRKKRIIYNLISLFIFIFLFFSGLFSLHLEQQITNNITTRRTIVEEQWRQQARTTLQGLKDDFLVKVSKKEIDPFDDREVQKWASSALKSIRNGGPTGDCFLVDMSDEELLWNPSPDMNQNLPTQYLYLEDTLELFHDPNSGEEVYEEMRKLYTTTSNSQNQWSFDESPEFLEWVIIPTDGLGFNSEPLTKNGKRNEKFKAYLLTLGTQQDEIFSPFVELEKSQLKDKNYLLVFNLFLLVFGIYFIVWFIYKDSFK